MNVRPLQRATNPSGFKNVKKDHKNTDSVVHSLMCQSTACYSKYFLSEYHIVTVSSKMEASSAAGVTKVTLCINTLSYSAALTILHFHNYFEAVQLLC